MDGDEVDDRPTTTTDEDDDEPPWGSKRGFMFSAPRQVRERGGHVSKGGGSKMHGEASLNLLGIRKCPACSRRGHLVGGLSGRGRPFVPMVRKYYRTTIGIL